MDLTGNKMAQRKARLREEALAARRAMTSEEVQRKSTAISDRLEGTPEFQNADHVLIYVDSKDNEVETRPLITRMLGEGRAVLVPVMQPGGMLAWSRLNSLEHLRPARFGILEPAPEHQEIISPPEKGLCVAPLLLYDTDLYRLGYGGGFYDRFASVWGGSTVGLGFDFQRVPTLPREPHDLPLGAVVTEDEVIR